LGSRRLEALSGTQVRIYASDSLDSARIITDNTGVVYYDADFTPFGGERAYADSYPTLFKFEGKMRDYETGNDDFGARYYSNRFGRWLSADWSNVPVAVPYANLTNPQTLNLYSMVADDPESFADLDGHISLPGQEGEGCSPVGGACSERESQKVPPGMSGCAIVGYICQGPTQGQNAADNPASQPAPANPNGKPTLQEINNPNNWVIGELPIGPGSLFGEAKAAAESVSVYLKAETAYVGITKDLAKREAQHGEQLIKVVGDLTRKQAKAVEQAIIEQKGLQNLTNKINSIARTNPIYQEAVQFGRELLKSIGF
jgi:RHS repeat-associated protein